MKSKITFFVLLLLTLLSCGKETQTQVDDAIFLANKLLSTRQCQAAIDLLEDVGQQPTNYNYVIAYASAYACKGGYSTLDLIKNDIDLVGSPSELGGFTLFSSSGDFSTSGKYTSLKQAIQILISSANGLNPAANSTYTDRLGLHQRLGALEIETLLVLTSMVQSGRFLREHGNTNAAGEKGLGGNGNLCLMSYSNVPFDAGPFTDMTDFLTSGSTGSCNTLNSGSGGLGTQGNLDVSRVCEGVVYLNNFFKSLENFLDNVGTGDLADALNLVKDAIETARLLLLTVKPGTIDVINTTSQLKCVQDFTGNTDPLEVWYAVMIETLFR